MSSTNLCRLTAVILTLNEEANIAHCIAAARQVADDIVIVDAYSTDNTVEISTQLGARVFCRAWEGYSSAKNFGNAQALGQWIISVDADEWITSELADEIQRVITQSSPDFEAYYLPFRTVFCGKTIYYGGWNPEKHCRLFLRHPDIYWAGAAHEELNFPPNYRIGDLKKGFVEHHTVKNIAEFRHKTIVYSTLFAQQQADAQKKPPFWRKYISPMFRFVKEYFWKLGFLDGKEGWQIATENARYTYLKYRKTEQLLHNNSSK